MTRRIAAALLLPLLSGCALVALLAAPAPAQMVGTPPLVTVPYVDDSGFVANEGGRREAIIAFPVVWQQASSVALHFHEVVLAGSIERGDASILRLTSLRDGFHQTMNAEHVRQWADRSAYFNGDVVLVEVIASPGTGPNRVVIEALEVGLPSGIQESQCGPLDDRVPSSDPRVVRLMPVACTAWMINDCAKCFLSAGHCGGGGGSSVQFNVPFSTSGGSLVFPPPSDQYAVDGSSYQFQNSTDDWQYFGVFANSTTGLTPFQAMGDAFDLVPPPNPSGTTIRITGHGTDNSPNSTYNQVQQTHTGPMTSLTSNVNYQVDTTGGNSGSPIIWEQQDVAIGVHTNGGCSTSGSGSNNGTPITASALQAALNNPSGRCLVADGAGADCNDNGIDDECDIASGTSQDLNDNDVPDECEPAMTWWVDAAGACPGSGTEADPFCTVADAIAVSLSGHTIIVRDGTYTGPGNNALAFGGRAITLRSENGPASTVLDAQNAFGTNLVAFNSGEGPDSVLEGFTLRGGNAPVGGGIHCVGSSPTIRNCRVVSNRAGSQGGGVLVDGGGPTIVNCLVADNVAGTAPFVQGRGGGIALLGGTTAALRNVTVAHNRAVDAGALFGQGGGVFVSASPGASLVSAIVWGNTAGTGAGIHVASGAAPLASHCNVQGGFAGTSMLTVDPQFVAAGPSGDYHLLAASACVGAGDTSAVGPGETDIDGEARVQGGEVEMGADEVAEDPWVDLGDGTSGVLGPPALVMSGPLTVGSLLGLDLSDASPSSMAVIFISSTSAPAAFLGGVLHAFPMDELVVLATDAGGGISGAIVFPGAPPATQLWFQVGIEDATVPVYGASLSNAMVGTVP